MTITDFKVNERVLIRRYKFGGEYEMSEFTILEFTDDRKQVKVRTQADYELWEDVTHKWFDGEIKRLRTKKKIKRKKHNKERK